jgi:hypothetical protein
MVAKEVKKFKKRQQIFEKITKNFFLLLRNAYKSGICHFLNGLSFGSFISLLLVNNHCLKCSRE